MTNKSTNSKSDQPPIIVPCPNCKKSVRFDQSNAFRPFCSNRCKMADFGDWANEAHRIPGSPANPFEHNIYSSSMESNTREIEE